MRSAVFILLLIPGVSLGQANPDFTRGDTISAGMEHDWTLGAIGARGWMFSDKTWSPRTHGRSRLLKWKIGSPADGILEVGDVILGVDGKPFSHDPRTELGKALTSRRSRGRWRKPVADPLAVR